MDQQPDHSRSAMKMSAFASRVTGIKPPPANRGPFMREMERPRTESYGELWRRANSRLSRF
jgi:hypothetical protein